MRERFKAFLIRRGYRETTPSGNPSTVYDYMKRIDAVCQWEQIDWQTLSQRIDRILPQYEPGGSKSHLGQKSHNAVVNALRRFHEFTKTSPGS